MEYNYSAACISRTGSVRDNNEDNFFFVGKYLPPDNDGLNKALCHEGATAACAHFAVFDGMGGEDGGEEAAYAAVRCYEENAAALERQVKNASAFLRDTAVEINLAVVARGREIRRERMGTTAAVLCVTREEAHIAHIGDSRIYRYRGGRLSALTEDDILRREHGQVLTQYLGVEPSAHSIHPHIRKGALRSGDLFLLCTDGVHGALSEREIAVILRRYGRDPTKCVETLTEQALEKNGEDNATAIVVRFYKKPWWQRTKGKGV